MLTTAYAASLRRDRRFGAIVTVALALVGGWVIWQMLSVSELLYRSVGAAVFLTVAFIVRAFAWPLLRAEPAPMSVIFDRRVYLPRDSAEFEGSESQRMALTLFGRELDALAEDEGVLPPSRFRGPTVEEGVARHDPEDGLRTVETLLDQEFVRRDVDLRAGLERLRRQLDVARAQGARFALMPVSSWSGQCEAIGLYLGTLAAPAEHPGVSAPKDRR